MKLFCIGVGPGNIELLTKQAFDILDKVELVFSGISARSGYKIAENTIFDIINDKEIVYFEYARTDRRNIELYWEKTADMIYGKMSTTNCDAVMITTGDPTIFSSFMLVRDLLESRGIETEFINGVSSVTSSAKSVGEALLMKDETLIVTTGAHVHRVDQYRHLLEIGDTVVFIKGQRGLKKLVAVDKSVAALQGAYIKNSSMHNEEVHRCTLGEIFDLYDWKRATIMVKKAWQ